MILVCWVFVNRAYYQFNTVIIVGHEWMCNKLHENNVVCWLLDVMWQCDFTYTVKLSFLSYTETHNGIYVPLSLYLTYSSSRLVWPYSMSHLVFTQNVHVWQCFHHKSKLGHTYNLHITSNASRVLKHTCTWSMFSIYMWPFSSMFKIRLFNVLNMFQMHNWVPLR